MLTAVLAPPSECLSEHSIMERSFRVERLRTTLMACQLILMCKEMHKHAQADSSASFGRFESFFRVRIIKAQLLNSSTEEFVLMVRWPEAVSPRHR